MTQQILRQIQVDLGPEQIVSARLLPVSTEEATSMEEAVAESNGKAEIAAEALATAEVEA